MLSREAELSDLRQALVVILVQIADLLEVVASRREVLAELAAMLNGRRKHDGFGGSAEVLVRLGDPFSDHVTDDLDAGRCRAFVREFPELVADEIIVIGRLADVDFRLNQIPLIDELARRDDVDHAIPMQPMPLVKGVAVRPIFTAFGYMSMKSIVVLYWQ